MRTFLSSFLFLLAYQAVEATSSGPLFNVVGSGASVNLDINLCLNGYGPLSCQKYNVTGTRLNITTTIPDKTYTVAGIKINTPPYLPMNCELISNGYCIFSVSQTNQASISIGSNAPWYYSLEAFEHYDSGRTSLFPGASFGGNYAGNNTVNTISTDSDAYPSGYSMAYLDAKNIYINGGGYGDIAGSNGAYLAKIDPESLQPIWYDQLINVVANGEWDYPGSMGILSDGYIYVLYGYRLAKISPNTGKVIATLILPTGEPLPENNADASFNGFNATSDGTIIMTSIYRQAGCSLQGPSALLNCPDPSDVPSSILVSVNPKTMQVIDNITLPSSVVPTVRPTIANYSGQNYVYLLETNSAIRYAVNNGVFTLDSTWNPGTIIQDGQTPASSFAVMNDWVITQTNTLPAATALSVIAINQGDASLQYSLQPFAGDQVPTLVLNAFMYSGPGGTQAISWAPASLSADPENNLLYVSDALPGEIVALAWNPDTGMQIVWKATQVTTEHTTIIGPEDKRVLIGTDIPNDEIPGNNSHDYVIWRNATTGVEIAHSASQLPAITQNTMIEPYYFGDMFYKGELGALIKLHPSAN